MIKLIYGMKGSGKSKKLLDMANAEASDAKGNIIYIDDNDRCIYDLKHEIRFVNISEYRIGSMDGFYGFICGLLSGDFDISSIYLDVFKKIGYNQNDNIELFLENLDKVLNDVTAYIIYSGGEDIPEYLKKYIDTK